MRRIFVFGMLLILLFGCAQQEMPEEMSTDQPQIETPESEPELGYYKGVSLSTRGDEYFVQFFEEAKEAGNMVTWVGDWQELVDKKAPYTLHDLSGIYDYTPLIEVGYYTQGEGTMIRPLTEENKQAYMESSIEFAEKYKPEYFGIGVEINIMKEKSPEDYEEFVALYNEVYDSIKEVSPSTKVFTVFQLEKMKGCEFWIENSCNSSNSHWELMDDFKSDIAAFTTYPGLVYADPSDIPEDHYTEINEHTSKPVAFLENGWHSEDYPPGWESSEEEQAEYVERFFELTEDLDVEVTVWSFMYGQGTIQPFDSMGLRRSDGTAKPAWDEWVKGGK